MVFSGIGCKKKSPAVETETVEKAVDEKKPEWRILVDEWEDPDPIPGFELIDQEGKPLSLDGYDDSFLLMGFVFSRCQVPEACPLTMKRLKEVQQLWKKTASQGDMNGRKLQILGVTLDPEFDTPDILKKYLLHHGGDPSSWSMVTGPEELVATELPSLFNVMALPDGKGSINHSVKVALLRPGRLFLKEWRDNKFDARDVVDLIAGYTPED